MSNLREIRKAAGLTQFQLAARANVSRFRICLAEAGDLSLRADELRAITDAVRPAMEERARIVSDFDRQLSVANA